MHRRLTCYMKPFRKSAFIVGHDGYNELMTIVIHWMMRIDDDDDDDNDGEILRADVRDRRYI